MTSPTPVRDIMAEVARHYRMPLRKMTDRDLDRAMVRGRHIAIYLALAITGKSKSEIGRRFHRHATTVAHAIRRIGALVAADAALAADVEALRERVGR